MNIVDWIDVGTVSAEKDEQLGSYYFDSGVLDRVISNSACSLVLGRKGAGKTAVFSHLTQNHRVLLAGKGCFVPLSLESYNWGVHALLTNPDAGESLKYQRSWRLVILVEAVKAWKAHFETQNRDVPKPIRKASELLARLFDTPIPSLFQIIGTKLLSLSKIKLPHGCLELEGAELDSIELSGGEVSFEDIGRDSSLRAQLSSNINGLITFLEKALQAVKEETEIVYLAFDKVDEAWDLASVENSQKLIAGLVSAAESSSLKQIGGVRVIVFLREDIFEVLSLNDKNKLREDSGTLLKWDELSLQKMLLMRINHFAGAARVTEYSNLDDLFDRKEVRQRTRPSKYILKRTMMRPRDVICFYKKIINCMKEEAQDPFSEGQMDSATLTAQSIYNAEPGYSEWLKQELIDEWSVQKPEIKDLLAAIQNLGSTHFSEDDLIRALGQLDEKYAKSNVRSLIHFLFDCSAVGVRVGNSAAWKFRAVFPTQGFVASQVYRVHDGLVRALNLTEPRQPEDET